jgi:hypothetical protein
MAFLGLDPRISHAIHVIAAYSKEKTRPAMTAVNRHCISYCSAEPCPAPARDSGLRQRGGRE